MPCAQRPTPAPRARPSTKCDILPGDGSIFVCYSRAGLLSPCASRKRHTVRACVSASPANEQPNEKRNERERMERGTQDKRSKDVHTGPPKGSLRAIFTWAAHFFSGDYLRTAPLPLTPSYIYTHRWHYQEENRAKCRPHPQVCGWQQNRIEQSAISFFFTGGSRDNLEQKIKENYRDDAAYAFPSLNGSADGYGKYNRRRIISIVSSAGRCIAGGSRRFKAPNNGEIERNKKKKESGRLQRNKIENRPTGRWPESKEIEADRLPRPGGIKRERH